MLPSCFRFLPEGVHSLKELSYPHVVEVIPGYVEESEGPSPDLSDGRKGDFYWASSFFGSSGRAGAACERYT